MLMCSSCLFVSASIGMMETYDSEEITGVLLNIPFCIMIYYYLLILSRHFPIMIELLQIKEKMNKKFK